MKTYYILLLSLLFLTSCSSNSVFENSFRAYELNQKVKSVSVLTYEAKSKFGDIVKGDLAYNPWETYNAIFNQDGYITELTNFDDDGDIYSKHLYTYNEKSLLIQLADYDRNGRLEEKKKYSYKGKKLCSLAIYDKDGSEKSRYEYVYDGARVIEGRCFEGENLSSRFENEYQTSKVLAKQTYFDADGKLFYEVQYNEKGQCIKQKGLNLAFDTEYNKYGLRSSIKIHGDDIDDITYFEYEYDKKQNWIKRISYKGEAKEPDEISERVINY